MNKVFTGLGLFVVVALLVSFAGCTVIKPGETGVLFNKITGSLSVQGPGFALWVPGRSVETYPTALRTYSMVARNGEGSAKDDDSLDLPSREGQHIRQDLSITYNTSPDRAADVFRSFKGDDISDIERT